MRLGRMGRYVTAGLTNGARDGNGHQDGVDYESERGIRRAGAAAAQLRKNVAWWRQPVWSGCGTVRIRESTVCKWSATAPTPPATLDKGNYGQAALDFGATLRQRNAGWAKLFRGRHALLVTPNGAKPIEEFKPGDWFFPPLRRPEGPGRRKRVEEVFQRLAADRISRWRAGDSHDARASVLRQGKGGKQAAAAICWRPAQEPRGPMGARRVYERHE